MRQPNNKKGPEGMAKVNKDMLIGEILQLDPNMAGVLYRTL